MHKRCIRARGKGEDRPETQRKELWQPPRKLGAKYKYSARIGLSTMVKNSPEAKSMRVFEGF